MNPFEKTPAEKEKLIIDMIERGYSYPQIMKELHVSPNTISSIIKKHYGTADLQSSKITKETQAFLLFEQGKSLINIKTELDIDSDDVIEYHRRYLDLIGADEYKNGYDKVKGNISPYLQMFDLMTHLGLTPDQVQEQVRYGIDLPNLRTIHTNLNTRIQDMAVQNRYLNSRLKAAGQQVQQYKNTFQFYENECAEKLNEIVRLDFTIGRKKSVIRMFDNSKEYKKIKESAKKEAVLVLQNNYALIASTVIAVLETIRQFPASQELFFHLLTSGAEPYSESWVESHKLELRQLGEFVQNDILEKISKGAIEQLKS